MTSREDRHIIYLPLSGTSIRLLSIKPGFPTEPIECAFVTVADLAESPPYDALSYVWGTDESPDPISCNGVQVTVTRQLADALKHLRRYPGWRSVIPWPKDHPLHSSKNAWNGFARNRHENHNDGIGDQHALLWVDALCINQKDDNERANQVKMMGKIYARASNVSIWLGKEDKEQPEFIQASNRIFENEPAFVRAANSKINGVHIGAYGPIPITLSFIAQALRNARGPKNRLATMKPMEDSIHRNAAYGFPPPNAPEWNIVRQFFTNPYFGRVWIVQEAVLARKATVLIGDWEIDWTAIGEAAVWFQSKGFAVPAVLKYQLRDQQDLLPVSKPVSMWNLCCWPDNRIPLLTLLHEFRNRTATNPRDKVYATFGIAEELAYMEERGFHQLIEPNYAKTVLDVYRDIARFLVIEHGNLAVLSHAGASLESNWPSWTPDWRHDKASNTMLTMQCANTYHASGDQALCIGISESANTISLQGIEADVITAYGDKLASYGFGYVTYREEVDFVRMAWGLLQPSITPASSSEDDVARAFIETLTAGLSNDLGSQADALCWFVQQAKMHLSIEKQFGFLQKQRSDPGRFHEAFVRACVDRRFFVTRNGLMGIGPDAMNEGDIIVILFGGRVPYLLRAAGDRTCYKFLGECYVPGLMDGEVVQTWKGEGSRRIFFDLV